MNERPETFAELRKMIREAKGVWVTAPFNDGSAPTESCSGLSVPITKEFAYYLYRGLSGEYWDNSYTAYWDDSTKELWVC